MSSLDNTGVWIEFDYLDINTIPKHDQIFFVCHCFSLDFSFEYERVVKWDKNLQSWYYCSFIVTKWLLDDKVLV